MGLFLYTSENSFQLALNQLRKASIKSYFQQAVFEKAAAVLIEPNGIEKIYKYAHLFEEVGLFTGKPWEDVLKLNPTLVRGTFHAGGITATAEALSNLRMLAIARGDYVHPKLSAYEAKEFLTKVMALNLDLLLMKETEENRVTMIYKDKQASEILSFISDHCFSPLVFESLYQEVENLAVQRPIVTDKILKLIASAKRLAGGLEEIDSRLNIYENSVYSPTAMSTRTSIDGYEQKLKACDTLSLTQEALRLRTTMNQSGLVSPFHVVFLKYVNKEKPNLVQHLLCLDEAAKENFRLNQPFISSIIDSAITMKTRRSLYGLMRLLQRDIFTKEFMNELEKLLIVQVNHYVENKLMEVYKLTSQVALSSLLVSEMISILGQPLGIGQGFNPTCQSTRAISYWAQTDPVALLKMFNDFLENGKITMEFEGFNLSSDLLPLVLLDDEDHIDSISLLIVPHLNSLYLEMLKAAKWRGEDPHKWVNPAFHIKGIWPEFTDLYTDLDFKTKFHRYYHPSQNPRVNEGLPQPVGITIYNQAGQVLGAHAVLIQRVAPDISGSMRVYFYNPNNDSLQVWGHSIKTSVNGNGEKEGESSLPFEDFLHCLYAFHYPRQD